MGFFKFFDFLLLASGQGLALSFLNLSSTQNLVYY